MSDQITIEVDLALFLIDQLDSLLVRAGLNAYLKNGEEGLIQFCPGVIEGAIEDDWFAGKVIAVFKLLTQAGINPEVFLSAVGYDPEIGWEVDHGEPAPAGTYFLARLHSAAVG